jgi:hypothetical protein
MLEIKPNADGTVTLSIGNESISVTAYNLDKQIEQLARARSRLNERVPDEPPVIEDIVINPKYMIRMDNLTKACLLRIRHDGFGWLNFELPSQEALNMKNTWKAIVDKLDLEPYAELYEGPERRSTKLH